MGSFDLLLWRNILYLQETFIYGNNNKNSLTEFFFSVTENFILWLKYVSITESWTETCLCDGNLFCEEFCFSDRKFCLTKTCFCDILWHFCVTEICFCHRQFFCKVICLCDRKLFCKKYPFLGFLYTISRENFLLEIEVFVIWDNQDSHFEVPWYIIPF